MAGTQGVTHLTQLVFAGEFHRHRQIALAEAHQRSADLTAGLYDAPDDLRSHQQHHDGRYDHHHHDHSQRDVGGEVLVLDDLVLLGLEILGQLVADAGSRIQGGSTLIDDHLSRTVPVGEDDISDHLSLFRPCLQALDEIVEQGAVLQLLGIGILHLAHQILQLTELGGDRGQALLIAGEGHVPQVAGSDIIVDPAVGDQLVRLHIVL